MGGFIIFPDGRAWAPSNALYDDAIEEIAAALPLSAEGRALSAWLLDRRSAVQGPGLGSVDLRELTATNRRLLLDTMATVFPAVPLAELRAQSPTITLTEPIDWFLVDRFQLLGHMVAAVRRGDPPEAINPLIRGLIPPTGRRAGPGWVDDSSSSMP